jgi:hypothetical protein
MIFYIVLFIFFILLFLCIWFLHCNTRTCYERFNIIEKCSEESQKHILNADIDKKKYWKQFYNKYENVSYNQHLWYLLTFRNPLKLY